MASIIEIRELGKKYKLAETQRYLALRDIISNAGKGLTGKKRQEKEFWALQHIDLDVEPGERIGIIGPNGAGKSTLLKILSRITPPTTGHIRLGGHVASLLEVGTGFHPELTGRENIFLNGAILGLGKKEIQRKLDEIIDFSGVENFIDIPLKQYSSGMQLRLAFSVAAHLEPDILLIDEVLAVGDMEFQKKCMGKMEEVSRTQGRTIILVSHDLSAITTLTEKCLLLEQGKMTGFDTTTKIISQYAGSLKKTAYLTDINNTAEPVITSVEIITSETGTLQAHGKPMNIVFEVNMPAAGMQNMALSFQVLNHLNQPVLFNWIFDSEETIFRNEGKNFIRFTYDQLLLYKGNYSLRVYLAETKNKQKFQEIDCCHFTVDMLNLKEPEWGWNEGVTQVLDKGKWEKE